MLNADARYARCEAQILIYEGGYSNSPKDRGGPTFRGTTLAELSAYLGHEATIDELKSMTDLRIAAIYRGHFWKTINGDNLPAGVDLICFDGAVNCGPGHAAGWLQEALGVSADGVIGPATLRALADEKDDRALIDRIAEIRLRYYKSLSDFANWGHGWSNRLNACVVKAKFWVGS